jgi:N-sulfoglucosamine sulfohydrolase
MKTNDSHLFRKLARFWPLSLALLLTPHSSLLTSSAAAPPPRPNIILFIADDMAFDDCGAYGNARVRTPHLDRLAREGMRFDRAFVTASSCSPSRASIITGRYPHATGAKELHWPLPDDQVTFVEQLKAAGYWTAAAGKWHLGDSAKKRFDVVHEADPAGFQLPTGKEAGSAKMVTEKDESGCAEWVPTLRERPKDKPFFLWLAALDPHRDYEANIIPQPHRPEDVRVPPYLPDAPDTRRDLALYYDEITRLDSFVGRVLDELTSQGVADNTVVVFLSDNGMAFPRAKTTVLDSGIKTPLLVRWPAKVKPGTACGSLVSSVDLAPTFLELAGLKSLASFQGVSFAKLLTSPTATVREHIFAEHNWHDYAAHERGVRDTRFKYIRNSRPEFNRNPPADAVRGLTFVEMRRLRDAGKLTPAQSDVFVKPRPAEELYDTLNDPQELTNLAADPKHARELRRLRAALDRWIAETDDVMPKVHNGDEFDRETGAPLPSRVRPRLPKSADRSY